MGDLTGRCAKESNTLIPTLISLLLPFQIILCTLVSVACDVCGPCHDILELWHSRLWLSQSLYDHNHWIWRLCALLDKEMILTLTINPVFWEYKFLNSCQIPMLCLPSQIMTCLNWETSWTSRWTRTSTRASWRRTKGRPSRGSTAAFKLSRTDSKPLTTSNCGHNLNLRSAYKKLVFLCSSPVDFCAWFTCGLISNLDLTQWR